MPPVLRDAPTDEPPAKSPEALDAYQLSEEAAGCESRNFLVIALYQIILRTGWIFKTESIVMPAVLDLITGGGPLGGLLRGCLPVLNRIGHSIPPMLFSRRLKVLARKRSAVLVCTLCMATMFAILSTMFWLVGSAVYVWMPAVFLACYVAFFAATGINNLSLGTLQGKLIHATRRGRLLLTANVVGAVTAIAAVSLLMPLWLTPEGGRFEFIFGMTAACFAVGALCILLIAEPRDDYDEPDRGVRHLFTSALAIVRTDRNFRRLALVAMAFATSLVLFPHYQALGRSERLQLDFKDLMLWVIIQNAGTALFSLITGPIADRRGNRVVMQIVLLGIAAMPVLAISLSHWQSWGPTLYPGVFLFIGLTPVGFKTLNNYTLEISPAEDHPRYLATLGLCFAVPLLLSPALGWVVEATSFEAVFFGVSGTVLLGWLLTFRLHEPREALHAAFSEDTVIVPEGE